MTVVSDLQQLSSPHPSPKLRLMWIQHRRAFFEELFQGMHWSNNDFTGRDLVDDILLEWLVSHGQYSSTGLPLMNGALMRLGASGGKPASIAVRLVPRGSGRVDLHLVGHCDGCSSRLPTAFRCPYAWQDVMLPQHWLCTQQCRREGD